MLTDLIDASQLQILRQVPWQQQQAAGVSCAMLLHHLLNTHAVDWACLLYMHAAIHSFQKVAFI